MHSALYTGRVSHRRFAPRGHAFEYRLFMVYLDLAELDRVFRGRWFWSTRRWAIARLRRADYLGDPDVPLDEAVRQRVFAETGTRPRGPIRMLTHLRYFGVCFNPVTFYYVFDEDGTHVETIVAEITNTPWNERHAYVLTDALNEAEGARKRYRFGKAFHVSPFLPMDLDYDWRFSLPDATLNVHMLDSRQGRKVFDATLRLRRQSIGGWSLAHALLAFPWITATVVAGIYLQALRLWLKRMPFHPHPKPPVAPDADRPLTEHPR
ncbi:MAG: DUF1365 domain-containing protein [Casimicrobiaceae bacterium]